MKKNATLLLLPALILSGGVFLAPFVWLVLSSLKVRAPGSLMLQDGLTLANYHRLLEDPFFARVMLDTVVLSGVTTLACLVIALPVSRFIVRRAGRAKGLLLALTLVPLVSGALLPALGLIHLLGPLGIFNGILKAFGLIGSSLRLLGTKTGVIVGLVQSFLPLMILPLVNAMSRLPRDVEDAAASLGAPPATVFRRVVLPLSVPGIVAGAVLVFCACLTSFVTPQILGQGKIATFGIIAYQQAALVLDWPFASTLAVAMLAVLAVCLLVTTGLQSLVTRGRRAA
ncbi:ABC transporter permease [Mesorhizobium sp. BAC0120]|uniref:ABC transporter permease n=1 Tax=Mesorhizobium sp. BAC0120 TaxID=3090670 RepID=UPI00298D3B7A|nr:ABC transporter permease [Mesorhizobium sp. BAC0120]MDW6021632.1 ABC transporter permease [Mesorhizobium sp. BAC0120]